MKRVVSVFIGWRWAQTGHTANGSSSFIIPSLPLFKCLLCVLQLRLRITVYGAISFLRSHYKKVFYCFTLCLWFMYAVGFISKEVTQSRARSHFQCKCVITFLVRLTYLNCVIRWGFTVARLPVHIQFLPEWNRYFLTNIARFFLSYWNCFPLLTFQLMYTP